jgi:hypothetical protein
MISSPSSCATSVCAISAAGEAPIIRNSISEADRRTKYPFGKAEPYSSVDRGELSQNFADAKAKLSQNVLDGGAFGRPPMTMGGGEAEDQRLAHPSRSAGCAKGSEWTHAAHSVCELLPL